MSTSRTFIVGDCHGDNSYIYNIQHKEKLTKNDYIIVCGDFGFVWNGDYKRQLYKLHKCTEAIILFVDGSQPWKFRYVRNLSSSWMAWRQSKSTHWKNILA